MKKTWRRGVAVGGWVVIAAVTALLVGLAPARAGGQTAGGGAPLPGGGQWEIGASGALFVDMPSERAAPWCDQTSGGVALSGTYWMTRWLGAEADLVLTGGLGQEFCLSPPFGAPQQLGVPFVRNRYEDGDFGSGMVAPTAAVAVEPFRGSAMSPRVKLGLGYMPLRGVGTWLVGGGVRFAFGRHALTMDGERWNMTLGIFDETVVFPTSGGPEQVLSSQRFDATITTFLVRIGWAMGVG